MFALIFSTLSLFLATFVPGLFFNKYMRNLPVKKYKTKVFAVINHTTDGVFLGLGLFHMIPEMLETAGHINIHPYTALLYFSLTLIFIFVGSSLYRLLFESNPKDSRISDMNSESSDARNTSLVFGAIAVLSFHSISEGVALGFMIHTDFFYILFTAILLHKWLESFIIASALNGSMSTFASNMSILGFSLMTPIGLLAASYGLSYLFNQSYVFLFPLYVLSAALFVYLGASAVMQAEKSKLTVYKCMLLGVTIIFLFEYVSSCLGVHV